jgi:hypothetical protein
LADHLQDDLRQASSKAAILTCEQVASIRTIASLRRESGINDEFRQILDMTVNKELLSTLKSAAVSSVIFWWLINKYYGLSQGVPFLVNVYSEFLYRG